MNECILCKSKKLINVQKINHSLIVDLYKTKLNIDVADEFKGNEYINALKCTNCKLLFFNPIISGSEHFYENLQHLDSEYYSDIRPEFLEALKFIEPNAKVLEIGSGSAYFAERLSSVNYVGLEYNQEAIEKAEKKGIKLKKESIEMFSENNLEQFDVVCSFHVLEHVISPYSYIESSLKSLKKGGKFICAVPCSDSYFTSNLNHVLNIPPHHTARYSLETFTYICKEFNLEIDYLYNDEVLDIKNYFEKKFVAELFKKSLPKQQIIINSTLLKLAERIVKRVNRLAGLYKSANTKDYKGKNMMIIATKK